MKYVCISKLGSSLSISKINHIVAFKHTDHIAHMYVSEQLSTKMLLYMCNAELALLEGVLSPNQYNNHIQPGVSYT